MTDASDAIAAGYDAFYAAWGRSATLRRIWRDHVTGSDFPDAFDHISFLPLTALQRIADALQLRPDDLLVDLACGAGGPGLWVARQTGARLVGRDLSPVAAWRATERAAALNLEARADFAPGTFEQTGLDSAAADAVMTIDALQYAPDKTKAFGEMARILRHGARLAFVAFELDARRVDGLGLWDDPVGDYRPLLEDTGFDIVAYEPTPDWERQVAAGFGAVVAEHTALAAEMGEAAAAAIVAEASITLEVRPYRGHVLAVAERR